MDCLHRTAGYVSAFFYRRLKCVHASREHGALDECGPAGMLVPMAEKLESP
jgi:hypothetical protein